MMARELSRGQTKAFRIIAALLALAACLFQANIAFISVKAQAWSVNDTSAGFIVLLLLVFVLFLMVMAAAAMIVSPTAAKVLAIVAFAVDAVVVVIVLSVSDDPATSDSLIDAAIRLAAPAVVIGIASLQERLEGVHLFR